MLQEISPNVSIKNSKEEFSVSGLTNPKTINDEISKQSNKFENLKFQYLEQEARDKFLRILLNNDPINVQHDDLNKLQIETQQVVQQEMMKGLDMNNKQREIDELTSELIDLNDKFNDKRDQNNEILSKIRDFETELDDLQHGIDKELLSNIDLHQFTNFDNYLQLENDKLINHKNQLNQLHDDINLKHTIISDTNNKITRLNQSLHDLLTSNHAITKSDYNNMGKWINEINKILNTFHPVAFDIHINDVIDIKVNDYFITLNKTTYGIIDHNCSVDTYQFNACHDKISKLSQIIMDCSGITK